MKAKPKMKKITKTTKTVIEVPELAGKHLSTVQLNTGTVIITTTYGVYAIYNGVDESNVKLLAAFA